MNITVKNLSFKHAQEIILDNVSFTIKKGDFVALIGPNGAGKTTLLKILLGELEAKGQVLLNKQTPQEFSNWKKVAYVPQQQTIDELFPGTVQEILNLEKSLDGCEELNTKHLLTKQFNKLSGGEQQRVLIQLALKTNPELLILDEPTTGVDEKTQAQFYEFIKHLNKEHEITIILVTHDISIVPKYAKNILCLNKKLVCHGPAKDAQKLVKKMHSNNVEVHSHA